MQFLTLSFAYPTWKINFQLTTSIEIFPLLSLASILLLLGFFFVEKLNLMFFFLRKLLVSFDNKCVVLVLCSNTFSFFWRFGCVKIGLIVFIVGACQQLIDWLSTTCQNWLWYYEKGKEWYGKNN